jgi:hypothetical protein
MAARRASALARLLSQSARQAQSAASPSNPCWSIGSHCRAEAESLQRHFHAGGSAAGSWAQSSIPLSTGRPRLVLLGTGWGAARLAHDIDTAKYDLTIISPRNHMVFTPLLASTCVGTLETRSVTVPIVDIQPALKKPQASAAQRRPDPSLAWSCADRPPAGASCFLPAHECRSPARRVETAELLLRCQLHWGIPRGQDCRVRSGGRAALLR